MDNVSTPPKRRFRRHSNSGGNNRATRAPATLTRQRAMSVPQINTGNDTENSWFTLELLYTVTDIVLIICGAIVVLACIAHLVLWAYGFYYAKVAKRWTSNQEKRP